MSIGISTGVGEMDRSWRAFGGAINAGGGAEGCEGCSSDGANCIASNNDIVLTRSRPPAPSLWAYEWSTNSEKANRRLTA